MQRGGPILAKLTPYRPVMSPPYGLARSIGAMAEVVVLETGSALGMLSVTLEEVQAGPVTEVFLTGKGRDVFRVAR